MQTFEELIKKINIHGVNGNSEDLPAFLASKNGGLAYMIREDPKAEWRRLVHSFKSHLTVVIALMEIMKEAENITPEQKAQLQIVEDETWNGIADLNKLWHRAQKDGEKHES